jgi:hypothetical protein
MNLGPLLPSQLALLCFTYQPHCNPLRFLKQMPSARPAVSWACYGLGSNATSSGDPQPPQVVVVVVVAIAVVVVVVSVSCSPSKLELT